MIRQDLNSEMESRQRLLDTTTEKLRKKKEVKKWASREHSIGIFELPVQWPRVLRDEELRSTKCSSEEEKKF